MPDLNQEKSKEYFMREALKEAELAFEKGEVPIGCVVVKDGEIIGRGHNQVEMKKSGLAHGEMIAIEEALDHMVSWRLLDCQVYVTVEPCPMCMGAIINSRVEKLIIGTDNPRFGAAGSVLDLTDYQAFNHKLEIDRGLLQEEAAKLMVDFFKNRREENKKISEQKDR